MIKKISLICACAISSYAYFNEAIVEEQGYNADINTYDYYAEGVRNTFAIINREFANTHRYQDKITFGNYSIVAEGDYDIAQIVFFKEIGMRLTGTMPKIKKKKDTKKLYIVYGNVDRKADANKMIEAVRAYNVRVQLLSFSKIAHNYRYFDMLRHFLPNHYQPVNLITTPAQPPKPVILKQNNKKFKPSIKQPNAENNATQIEEKVLDPVIEQNKKCINTAISTLKNEGYFNLEAKQFKLNDVIYQTHSELKLSDECVLKISSYEVNPNKTNFTIKFNDMDDPKMNAKIKIPMSNWFKLETLLYNPYDAGVYAIQKQNYAPVYTEPQKTKNTAQYTEPQKTKNTAQYAEPQKTQPKNENMPGDNNLAPQNTIPTEQAPQEQNRPQEEQSSLIPSGATTCNFDTKTVIRTRVQLQADVTTKRVAVYDFYKNKKDVVVDISVNSRGNYELIALGGDTMEITAQDFKKGCKVAK